MKKYIILILIILEQICINEITFGNEKYSKQIQKLINEAQQRLDSMDKSVVKEEEFEKYANYLDDTIKDKKCEGYDFDPEKIQKIILSSQKKDERWSVILSNGKRFEITHSTMGCVGTLFDGKDGYKQLPDGCRFVIGNACISPVPSDCKKISKNSNTCFDKEVNQDYKIFQWECTNKGWERMTSYREYWDDECAP